MITFKASLGNINTLNIIAKMDKSFNQALRRGLQQSGIRIAGAFGRANDGLIKQKMNQPKHGRIYGSISGRKGRLLKRLRLYQASAPGESPAVVSGRLRESVYFKVEGSNQLRIGADTPYARILEKGGGRIKRRSYLIRPILESRRNIINDIKNAVNSGIKK